MKPSYARHRQDTTSKALSARGGRLKGYGNSIVSALAAEFIMAYEAVAVDGQEVA